MTVDGEYSFPLDTRLKFWAKSADKCTQYVREAYSPCLCAIGHTRFFITPTGYSCPSSVFSLKGALNTFIMVPACSQHAKVRSEDGFKVLGRDWGIEPMCGCDCSFIVM